MVFLLTASLSEKIVRAMENQEEKFLLCAENLTLVSAKTANVDDENYYSLPEWNSSSGFELREDFVASLQNPMAHDKLQAVLHSGRGVFRNFKDELKKNPVIERQWHIFKNKKMLEKVGDWYNGLREIWGLEKLDLAPEDNEYILLDDFTFIPYTKSDSQIICGIADTADDFEGNLPSRVKDAVHELWRRNFLFGDSLSQTGFICNTLSNEFAGCITAAPVSKRTEKIMILTSFFVPEKFRGLGIGTELLNKCLSDLKTLKKEGILLLNTIISDSMESLLLNSGFRKVGSGYLAEI